MRKLLLFVALLSAFSPLFGEGEYSEELFVELSTEKQLLPAFVAGWKVDDETVTTTYVNRLHQILAWDLNHNGSTEITGSTVERETLALDYTSFDPAAWRELGVCYLVQGRIVDGQLFIVLSSATNGLSKTFPPIPLSWDVTQDRRRLHQLSDGIHLALFGTPGIASTRFLFTVRTESPTEDQAISEVWVADYDGKNAEQLTHEGNYCVTPTFLPPAPGKGSGSFFYVSYRMGLPKIYVASLRDGAGRRFSYLRGNQLMPAITSHRDHVAFVSDAAGNPDLFLQKFNPEVGAMGKPRQIYSAPRGAQASPTFNRNGSKLAFVSNKDGSPRIYVMDVPAEGVITTTSEPLLISKQNRGNTSPAWSPDGTKIAYSAMTRGTRQIWIYDFESDHEWQLSTGHGHKENPTWAPNSLHLIYNTEDRSGAELYLIDLNKRRPERISSGRGEKRFPAWDPA
jgi:TolB protein